jgi:hypothetical protein
VTDSEAISSYIFEKMVFLVNLLRAEVCHKEGGNGKELSLRSNDILNTRDNQRHG